MTNAQSETGRSPMGEETRDDAEEWEECGFGVCGDCNAGLIDDGPCLRCKWQERRAMGMRVWQPCNCHLHEQQVCDLCQGVPKPIERSQREGDAKTEPSRK